MILALGSAGWLAAQEQDFTFALPDIEGRISLGVFDEHGKLVRTLKVGATEKDFVIELNGLFSKWDGKDDAGVAMPSGKYFIRGYMVGGSVKAEGVAFHFNDWIESEDSPAVRWLLDFDWLPDGKIVALGETAHGKETRVFAYQPDQGMLWSQALPLAVPIGLSINTPARFKSEPRGGIGGVITITGGQFRESHSSPMITADEAHVAVLEPNGFFQLDPKSGAIVDKLPFNGASPRAATSEGSKLFVSSTGGVATIVMPGLTGGGTESTPVTFDALEVSGGKLVGGSVDRMGLWTGENGKWTAIEVPFFVVSVDFGKDATYWAVGRGLDDTSFVGQFSPSGEFLRSYRGDLEARVIRASRLAPHIAVLAENGLQQKLSILKLTEPDGWEIDFEKTIERCERFGLKDGKLVADAGEASPPNKAEVPLSTGGLRATAPNLEVLAVPGPDGLWLTTKAGLKLLRITDHAEFSRVALQKAGKGLQVFAGNGVVVAEYAIEDVSQIAEIDAGEVDLP